MDISVDKAEIFFVMDIVQHAFSHIIVDPHALFLDNGVITGGVHLQTGS